MNEVSRTIAPVTLGCLLLLVQSAYSQSTRYGNRIAALPADVMEKLAMASAPNESGAVGRNKRAYFHVRFQSGIHRVADYGLATKKLDVLEKFVRSVEYSMKHQMESGDFSLEIPAQLRDQGKPSVAERASGVAFFASSLGLGLHALDTNDWFQESPECEPLRKRIGAVRTKLQPTLQYLIEHRKYLEKADRRAPNRLLFDGIGILTLGKLLKNDEARGIAMEFIQAATDQTHEDGYFIEGGGFDSSYNGVAAALALRLLMLGHDEEHVKPICTSAMQWQKARVLDSGEISTDGNARVRPNSDGESFLGRKKDVDVGHSVEAFALASECLSDGSYAKIARRVIKFYQ